MTPRQRFFPLAKRMSIVSWTVVLALFSAAASSAQELSKLPYVPTPQVVVDEMLKMANVTGKDFVIDLGSGDGRMIITAAKTLNANGLGVDIDKKLVDLSNRQAKADGVDDRAKFIEQDMFRADIGKATVVTLYVLPDFMEKLRPKLLAELKPGTRIVAHDYYMREWYPDRQFSLTVPEKVKVNGTDKAYLYLWIVPSVVRGGWRMEFDAGGSSRQLIVLDFAQQISNDQRIRRKSIGTDEDRQYLAPRRPDQLRSFSRRHSLSVDRQSHRRKDGRKRNRAGRGAIGTLARHQARRAKEVNLT